MPARTFPPNPPTSECPASGNRGFLDDYGADYNPVANKSYPLTSAVLVIPGTPNLLGDPVHQLPDRQVNSIDIVDGGERD